jgi:hypothetical protein
MPRVCAWGGVGEFPRQRLQHEGSPSIYCQRVNMMLAALGPHKSVVVCVCGGGGGVSVVFMNY